MSSKLIFVTGATGFIGSHVVKYCLREGYRVRLSVRKPEQIQRIKDIFPTVSDLDFVVVQDIASRNAFDGTLADVDAILHLASPLPGKGSDLHKDYLEPAIRGTLSILEAATMAPSVKRVIIMSSVLALAPVSILVQTGGSVKANTGEKVPLDLEKEVPEDIRSGAKYQASKILAHQAYRDWVKEHKPSFLVATIHPTFVLGPSLIQRTAEEIDFVNGMFWMSLQSEAPLYTETMVDVRDVANACVKSIAANVENETEFILSNPTCSWEQVAELVRKEFPSVGTKIAAPGPAPFEVDVSTAEQVLGVKWTLMEDSVRDTMKQQLSFRNTSGDAAL